VRQSGSVVPSRTRDEHLFDPGPKRILCLDGGGLRGSLTLGILKEMEDRLRDRHGGDPGFRLAHYFDLIAGTSTGAIIAATLARGMSVCEIYEYYEGMGREVFKRTLLGKVTLGLVRPRYRREVLEEYLKQAVGPETTLGDESLMTGLLIIAKRIDSHSVWAMGNNPRGRYYDAPEGSTYVPNHRYPLWELLRASAAAPTYFDPVKLEIGDRVGDFIDGGMSPFNDPSLQTLMYATLDGYRLKWPTGANNLLLISVGTGTFEPPSPKVTTGIGGILKRFLGGLIAPGDTVRRAFFSLLHDNQVLTRTLLQWASATQTASEIDSEMGDLRSDLLGGQALLSHARFDADLAWGKLKPLVPRLATIVGNGELNLESLTLMDEPGNVPLLWEIGRDTGARTLRDEHFPPDFDLDVPGAKAKGGAPASVVRVGIVGHRNNRLRPEDIPALVRNVEETLDRVAQMCASRATLSVTSALAEGADRLGAEAALEAGYRLECPLPFPRQEYENDFDTDESRREFRKLLCAAHTVWELPGTRGSAPEAYAAVGNALLAHSDLLIAIWDGEEAHGRGGTAEVVHAAAVRMPVVWIHADPAVENRLLTPDEDGAVITRPVSELGTAVAAIL
jgi:hypothetical protein